MDQKGGWAFVQTLLSKSQAVKSKTIRGMVGERPFTNIPLKEVQKKAPKTLLPSKLVFQGNGGIRYPGGGSGVSSQSQVGVDGKYSLFVAEGLH